MTAKPNGRPRVGTTVQLRVPDEVLDLADREAEARKRAGLPHAATTRAAILRDWLLRGTPHP